MGMDSFEYKDSNGLQVTSVFSWCFDKVLLIIPSPIPHTHIYTHRKQWYDSRQDLPYAELTCYRSNVKMGREVS